MKDNSQQSGIIISFILSDSLQCAAAWPVTPLLQDYSWLTELLSGSSQTHLVCVGVSTFVAASWVVEKHFPVLLLHHPSADLWPCVFFCLSLRSPPWAACGVNCHKACRSRLAVECRKRTKSISHESPPGLQSRSYSFPPPANSPPNLQNTGEWNP